jgi:four helix bundle protein
MELETHLLLSERVGYRKKEMLDALLMLTDRIGRMLSGLRKALEKRL